jgi:TetR/AcrR family transcriptional regulator, transcriptional repressor for nem operon
MRYPKEQKAETRARILGAAARLFRESGYDGVGIDAIMSEAGLTAGGFYAHFFSKETLFAEAMATVVDPGKASRAMRATAPGGADPLSALIKGYLSRTHRDTVGEGCPLPALTSDVARKSDETRESYERQFLRFVNEIEGLLGESSVPARERALAIVSQCVGGLMLSRAVKSETLSDQILKSCRRAARAVRNGERLVERS